MLIQYYGDYCFKIATKPGGRATEDVVLWTDPLGKGAGLRSPQGEANVVILSHEVAEVRESLKGEPVILDMPGEYAAYGISAQGFLTARDLVGGEKNGLNTVFAFESEDLHIAYLGALGHDLPPEVLDKLGGTDILFLPIGGKDTLPPEVAATLVRKIEPKIVIPMHYKIPGLTLDVQDEKAFCDSLGNCPKERVSKLNIKKKDLEGKNLEVVLFERGV